MKLKWDELGEKSYETGVSKGVFFPFKNKKYTAGIPWNGLAGFTNSPSGAEETKIFADNGKYLSLYSAEDFGGTLEAYTAPDEFAPCDGLAKVGEGVYFGQQDREPFAFSYQTIIGNDTEHNNHGYKIHIIYGCMAKPTEKAYKSVNESPEAMTMSWGITTTPITVEGYKPVAHIEIDSTKVDAETLKAIEDKLYGGDDSESTLIMPDEIIALITKG